MPGERVRRPWYQLEERHAGVLVARLLAAAVVAGAAALVPAGMLTRDTFVVVMASAAAAAVQVTLWVLPRRWPRRLRLCVDAGIVVDVAWAATVVDAAGGVEGPAVGLFLVVSLIAALGYSARTGLKAGVLSTIAYLLLAWPTPGAAWTLGSISLMAFFWGVLAVSILGAAAGERELRLRAERLDALHHAAAALLSAEDKDRMEAIAVVAAGQVLRGWRAQMASIRPTVDATTLAREGGEGVVVVPVPGPEGPVGAIECRRALGRWRQAHHVRAGDLEAVETIATGLGSALWRERLVRQLAEQSLTDALTGLPNRRALDAELERTLATAADAGRCTALCLADVDHFKEYNDQRGHQSGDAALAAVAKALASSIRRGDLAARYGGEEFALVLPGADLAAARAIAERVRATVAAIPSPLGPLTLSIGVATAPGTCSAEVLTEAADRALYAAKRKGRDRVESESTLVGARRTPDGDAPARAAHRRRDEVRAPDARRRTD